MFYRFTVFKPITITIGKQMQQSPAFSHFTPLSLIFSMSFIVFFIKLNLNYYYYPSNLIMAILKSSINTLTYYHIQIKIQIFMLTFSFSMTAQYGQSLSIILISIRNNPMKNYPALYSSILSKKGPFKPSKTPKKSTTFTGATLTSKASTKTLGIYNSTLNRQKKVINRLLTRSIQQQTRSQNQSQEFNYASHPLGSQDQQLFSQSYSKIGKIKQEFPYKNIDVELNEVLNIIREQKLKINDKLKNLKKSNDYYKKICQSYFNKRTDYGINTQQIISSANERAVSDKGVGCQQNLQIKIVDQQHSSRIKQDSIVDKEIYLKLSSMLQQMGINPNDILPTEDQIKDQILISDYKALTDKQTIRIQKFFIKKLIDKISK